MIIFITENKNVRECLPVLYRGEAKLNDKNFQDILKFMVTFEIPNAWQQVLDWMSQNWWILDIVGFLINGSMVELSP